MHRTKVESSNVAAVGFDRESGILEVEYTNGTIYQYPNTKPDAYAGLMGAKSKGRYLHQYFVQPGRDYVKVEPETEGEEGRVI